MRWYVLSPIFALSTLPSLHQTSKGARALTLPQSFIAYCLGNIIGPQLFFEREAPTYQSSFLALLICLIVEFAMCWIIRGYLIWENDRRDKRTTANDVAAFEAARHGVMVNLTDMTDKEIPQFRYVY